MDIDALKRAQSALELLDMQQISVSAYVGKEYDPRLAPEEQDIAYQTKQGIVGLEIIGLEGNGETSYILRTTVDFGIRFVPKPNDKKVAEDTPVLGEIEAVYRLDYKVTDEALVEDTDAIQEFATHNAPHQAWPFWREFVDSQTSKMRLPRLILPMQTIGRKSD